MPCENCETAKYAFRRLSMMRDEGIAPHIANLGVICLKCNTIWKLVWDAGER